MITEVETSVKNIRFPHTIGLSLIFFLFVFGGRGSLKSIDISQVEKLDWVRDKILVILAHPQNYPRTTTAV